MKRTFNSTLVICRAQFPHYTRSNHLMRSLLVTFNGDQMSLERIRGRFDLFGEHEAISVSHNEAIISFHNAMDCASLLRNADKVFGNEVNFMYAEDKYQHSYKANAESISELEMFDVLDFLSFEDLSNFAVTSCKMLLRVELYLKRVKQVETGWGLRQLNPFAWNIQKQLELLAPNVTVLKVSSLSYELFEMIVASFPKLTELHIEDMTIEKTKKILGRITHRICNVKLLTMKRCSVLDSFLTVLKWNELDEIHLKSCTKITGHFLSVLNAPKLNFLNLTDCPDLSLYQNSLLIRYNSDVGVFIVIEENFAKFMVRPHYNSDSFIKHLILDAVYPIEGGQVVTTTYLDEMERLALKATTAHSATNVIKHFRALPLLGEICLDNFSIDEETMRTLQLFRHLSNIGLKRCDIQVDNFLDKVFTINIEAFSLLDVRFTNPRQELGRLIKNVNTSQYLRTIASSLIDQNLADFINRLNCRYHNKNVRHLRIVTKTEITEEILLLATSKGISFMTMF